MLAFFTHYYIIYSMTTKYAKLIKDARLKKGISQLDMSVKLGMSRPSYILIEQGKKDLTMGEFEKINNILGVTFEEIESGESPDYEKYKQMILAFLRENKEVTKTKLAKLLYFADFSWFYENLESMSGMQYRKIKYGPVADSYFRIIDEMFDSGEISIEQKTEGAMIISETRSGAKIHLNKIKSAENNLIKKINTKWKDKKTSEIVDFTHKQMPFLFANENEIVSYDIFGQENPDEIF
jgi:transcriptional regulator with XRE-family HTH domain